MKRRPLRARADQETPKSIGSRPTSTLNDLPSPYFKLNNTQVRGLNAEEIARFRDGIQRICDRRASTVPEIEHSTQMWIRMSFGEYRVSPS